MAVTETTTEPMAIDENIEINVDDNKSETSEHSLQFTILKQLNDPLKTVKYNSKSKNP